MSKRTLLNLGKYALALSLLAWVVSRNWAPPGSKGLKYVWQRHAVEGAPVGWGYLAGAALCFAFALVVTLVRWFVLVRAQGLPFRFRDALRLGLIGFFFNSFLPGSVGGDIIKAAFLAREQSRRTVAVATVIMDRLIALWGLIWFVAVLGAGFWAAGMLEGEAAATSLFIVECAAAVVAVTVAAWLLLGLLPARRAERFAGRLEGVPKVGGSAAEFWRAVWMYRCRQGSVALALLISWVGFFGFIGCFYCSARALWDGVPTLTQHFLLVPIGLVIQAVPLFPGGVGIGEWGFGGLYRLFGHEAAGGVLGSLVQRVLSWVLGLAGYALCLWLPARRPGPPVERGPAPEPALAGVGDGGGACPDDESLTAG